MRHLLVLIVTTFFCGFGIAAQELEFKSGEVWELENPAYENAVLLIEAVEKRGEKNVIHMSVFGLPGPHSSAILFDNLREMTEEQGLKNEPISYLASGHSDGNGRFTLMTAVLTLHPGAENSRIALPHIAAYESDLREAVSNIHLANRSSHSMYDELKDLWRQGEEDWPEILDHELEWPFSSRLEVVIHSVTISAFDQNLSSRFGPPPPANAGPKENETLDPVLDKLCREIAAPKPLSPEVVDRLVENGMPRERIPIPDIILDNISITRSDDWGHIWRADAIDRNARPPGNVSRTVCWRRADDMPPAATWYPIPVEE